MGQLQSLGYQEPASTLFPPHPGPHSENEVLQLCSWRACLLGTEGNTDSLEEAQLANGRLGISQTHRPRPGPPTPPALAWAQGPWQSLWGGWRGRSAGVTQRPAAWAWGLGWPATHCRLELGRGRCLQDSCVARGSSGDSASPFSLEPQKAGEGERGGGAAAGLRPGTEMKAEMRKGARGTPGR